jgi:hypothetical protein
MIIAWPLLGQVARSNSAIAKRYFYLELLVKSMTVEAVIMFFFILLVNNAFTCNPADVRGELSRRAIFIRSS